MCGSLNLLDSALVAFVQVTDLYRRPVQYLDPGSGSYILQLLIAAALGAAFALKHYWRRVKGFFSKVLGKTVSEEDD